MGAAKERIKKKCCFFFLWHVNFRWLLNAKVICGEEQQWYYLIHIWEDKGVHAILMAINLKMNGIGWVEFELAYYESTI